MPQLRLRDEDCIGAWYLNMEHKLVFRSLRQIRELTANRTNENYGFDEHLGNFRCFTYVWKIPKEPPGPTVEHGILWIIKVLREAHNRGARRESLEKIARENQVSAPLLRKYVLAGNRFLEDYPDIIHLAAIRDDIEYHNFPETSPVVNPLW